jgi:hypothetical protein
MALVVAMVLILIIATIVTVHHLLLLPLFSLFLSIFYLKYHPFWQAPHMGPSDPSAQVPPTSESAQPGEL